METRINSGRYIIGKSWPQRNFSIGRSITFFLPLDLSQRLLNKSRKLFH